MQRKKKARTAVLLTAFVLWTWAVCKVDSGVIGPQGSTVGFSAMNEWFHRLTGVHWKLYHLTDRLSLIPLAAVAGFGLLGLRQWIGRKSLRKVDRSILLLGGFYITVMAVFLLFEKMAVNYRPVLIEGILEVSYPSSTTMLVMCVMPAAGMQLRRRMKRSRLLTAVMGAFTFFMVMGRLLSGVHWLSDIFGGVLLSAGLVAGYAALQEE